MANDIITLESFFKLAAENEAAHRSTSGDDFDHKSDVTITDIISSVTNMLNEDIGSLVTESYESFGDMDKDVFTEKVHTVRAMETYSLEPDIIRNTLRDCKVPAAMMESAIKETAQILNHYGSGGYSTHFSTNASDGSITDLSNILGPIGTSIVRASHGLMSTTDHSAPALEAFGVDIDNSIADVRLAIVINVLKYHKNLIDRLIPRRALAGHDVRFEIGWGQIYDLDKSAGKTSDIRNHGDHLIPAVMLGKDPSPANTAPKKVELLKVNDDPVKPVLIEDGIFTVGERINLFDLSSDVNKITHAHTDFTDLISDGAILDFVIVEVKDDQGVAELFKIDLAGRPCSRFTHAANNENNADRVINGNVIVALSKDTQTSKGATSALLANFVEKTPIRMTVTPSGNLNLMSGDLTVNASASAKVAAVDGTTVVPQVLIDEFNKLTFAVKGAAIEAYFDEQNMRKTTTAVRAMKKTRQIAIPVGKNISVEYSLAEQRPSDVLALVRQVMAVGNDDRALQLIQGTMDFVARRLEAEKKVPNLEFSSTVAADFVAGLSCLPAIHKSTIDIADDKLTVRSGDELGDLRAVMDRRLLEIMALLISDSMYHTAVPNEEIVFNGICSNAVLNALMQTEYYHGVYNKGEVNVKNQNGYELTRILPNGFKLNFITTTFDYMTDKVLIFPYRPNAKTSEFNFAQNCDCGTYVANYTPTIHNGASRRIVTNTRELPIVTNPLGAMLTIKGVSAIFSNHGKLGDMTKP